MAAVRIEFAALAALTGNLFAQQLAVLPATPVLALAAVLAALLLMWRRTRLAGVVLAFFSLTVVGADRRLADRWPLSAGRADIAVSGWVDEFPVAEAGRVVFTLRTDAAGESRPRRLRLTWYEAPFVPVAGQSLALTARIRPPRGLANPGGFDYERWLLTENIGATGYVRDGHADPARTYGLAQTWLQLRADLARRIAAAVDDPAAEALLVALALGVRAGFGDEQWQILRRTGTSHLVAISGLHVGLVAMFAFQSLLWLALRLPPPVAGRAWPVAAALAMIPAFVYAALAGFALPAVRAVLMLAVAQAVILTRRRVVPLAGLALALLVVLVADPLATLGGSFWLSFAAVAAIVCFAGRADSARGSGSRSGCGHGHRFLRAARTLATIQLVVGLGLLPITALFFGEVSVAGLLVNIVAVPFFSGVLVPVSFVLVLTAMADIGTRVVARMAEPLASAAWHALGAVAQWPYAAIEFVSPGTVSAGLAVAGFVVFFAARSQWRWLGLLAALPLFLRSAPRPAVGDFSVTVLDVGHGLAVVVRTARRTLLFDTGPLSRSGFDAGSEVVVPALDKLSPGRLDRIVVSHGDSDHAGGLRALRSAHPTAELWTGPDMSDTAAVRCEGGQRWTWDHVEFSVLHPAAAFPLRGNDSSCVIRIAGAGGSVLLTGDIERRAESVLLADLTPVDVVVAPHHGSATSSSPGLVNATRPAFVIVSAAHDNRWDFPRPQVVARWRAVGADVVTTGDVGAVTVLVTASAIRLTARRQTRLRYWAAASGTGSGSAL